MSNVIEELLELLRLEELEKDRYLGKTQDLGYPRVFGGQVLGQALVAAKNTVEGWMAHSMHAYFLRPGNPKEPIEYKVDRIRDGRSFTTRTVVASQGGRAIFNLSASFQVEEKGYEHQKDMPDVAGPENLPSELDRARQVKELLPEKMRYKLTCERPIEIRVVEPVDYFNPKKRKPVNYSWIKTTYPLPDDPMMHQCMLAYASDFGLIEPSMMPHGVTFAQRDMQVASLDHAMWFHKNFRMDEWLLYETESLVSAGGRGLNSGRFYTKDGTLVASATQEGLIRNRTLGQS